MIGHLPVAKRFNFMIWAGFAPLSYIAGFNRPHPKPDIRTTTVFSPAMG